MKVITEAPNLKGKRVLVRVDWNVLRHGRVIDPFRIYESKKTIEFLLNVGATPILATHLEEGATDALKPYVPEGAELLPNLRENPGEEGNSDEFAKELASKADVYINEAFPVSHRNHASIVKVPKLLPSFAGFRFIEEVHTLSKAFYPKHPFLFILGGAKFDTKIPLVEKFLNIADTIFIGGAMAKRASELPLAENPKVIFPTGNLEALDANDRTLELLKEKINEAKFIIWNGPLGKYEDGFTRYTHELARALADSKAEVVIGGGDTLASIAILNITDKYHFVSTGGGAMLDFLAHGTLPGIEALK